MFKCFLQHAKCNYVSATVLWLMEELLLSITYYHHVAQSLRS